MMTLIKRLFGIGRAKRNEDQEGDQIDFEVKDLRKGFILDYNLSSWEVDDVVTYTWDNGVKDLEFNLKDGQQTIYLSYESIGGHLSVYSAGDINEIWKTASMRMRKDEDLTTAEFTYKGETFYYSGEGAAQVKTSSETFHMQNWLFKTDASDTMISLNKYEDNATEAYIGKTIGAHEITNILPR